MNQEDQRIAIAEACPRIVLIKHGKAYWRDAWRDIWRDEANQDSPVRLEFDPLSDLNAMHEAVEILSPVMREVFADHLYTITRRDFKGATTLLISSFNFAHASAAQQAEAFLKTLNLWKD